MNNHTICILGASGSGKTTFLASFFKKLSLLEKYGFFLKTEDPEKRKYLIRHYERLANNGEWPAGTRDISRWVFNCHVQTPDLVNVKACRLSLFDYKGGLLTDAESDLETEEDFQDAIDQSSAILAILDGQKILRLMQDTDFLMDDVTTWIEEDLNNALQLIEGFGRQLPLHFVITKWDIIEDANYSLADIKQRLFKRMPSLKNLVQRRHRANCPVYLIPVSAVGQNFVTLKNGCMERNPGIIPSPDRVEVPLALTLTDLHKEPISAKPIDSPQPQRKGFKFGFLIYFLIGLGTIAIFQAFGLLLIGAYMLFRMLRQSKAKNNQANHSEAPIEAISPDDAFHRLLNECRQIREEFLSQFPEAICKE